ncbi:GapA-binding peptide SR1P [Aeribacillus composti]
MGMREMTQIICQDCGKTIEFVSDGKSNVLYGKCKECQNNTKIK